MSDSQPEGTATMILHITIAFPRARLRLALTAAMASGAMIGGQPAEAAVTRKATSQPAAALIPPNVAAAARTAAAPLITVVSIGDQRITVYAGDKPMARAGVSTGAAGHRTPTGIFSVIGKERYHESNLYSNAPMPFMQRITWSGIALHEGNLPGYPASHGCIRLSSDFAPRLYGMSRMGMRVIVTDRDLAPVAFAHSNLPSPTFTRASDLALVAPIGSDINAERMLLGAGTADDIAGPGARLLNPLERGRLEQGRTKALAQEAQSDALALLDIAAARGHEARLATESERTASNALRAVTAGRDAAEAQLRLVDLDDSARQRLAEQRAALDTAYKQAMRAHADAQAHAAAAEAAAFQAAAEAKAAVTERDAAEQAARVADRATEPLSIFVSRKERRVFVRQGFEQVFSADIEIADADVPLGTHAFTAVAAPSFPSSDAGAPANINSGAMTWVAVTIPGQARVEAAPLPRSAKSTAARDAREQTVPRVVPATAAAALDRIKFPDDVLEVISSKVWTGASLIVSDYGISGETGKGTDFVVLTK